MIEKNKSENIAILNFIQNNPTAVVLEPKKYANVLTYAFPDDCYPLNDQKFPKMRLRVTRLTNLEVTDNLSLLTHFYDLTAQKNENGFTSVWLTTAHLETSSLVLAELSFE
ncbi:hypothetical protein ACFQ5M_03860 [Agrilactobacillus yilanensis]|uniref:Uncharacterized protein n=1 Tax=Agrilactobacillus yilanensis TaxID=2485997 RepID=A0ABW4J6D8_9LACO|nr:hypothetical protein [Agrilactobacillus yilanensis]